MIVERAMEPDVLVRLTAEEAWSLKAVLENAGDPDHLPTDHEIEVCEHLYHALKRELGHG